MKHFFKVYCKNIIVFQHQNAFTFTGLTFIISSFRGRLFCTSHLGITFAAVVTCTNVCGGMGCRASANKPILFLNKLVTDKSHLNS